MELKFSISRQAIHIKRMNNLSIYIETTTFYMFLMDENKWKNGHQMVGIHQRTHPLWVDA